MKEAFRESVLDSINEVIGGNYNTVRAGKAMLDLEKELTGFSYNMSNCWRDEELDPYLFHCKINSSDRDNYNSLQWGLNSENGDTDGFEVMFSILDDNISLYKTKNGERDGEELSIHQYGEDSILTIFRVLIKDAIEQLPERHAAAVGEHIKKIKTEEPALEL